MQQNNGDVLVVCGGWHAPALANMWRECPQEINKPELPSLADAVTGCYLTPYSEKRLDVLAGYLSGMHLPQSGKTGAGSVAYSRQVNNC